VLNKLKNHYINLLFSYKKFTVEQFEFMNVQAVMTEWKSCSEYL